jgi:hypothetical protein
MFSHEGPAVFPQDDSYWQILGWLNTSVCQGLINLYCGQHKTAGYVAQVPCPNPSSTRMRALGAVAEQTWKTLQSVVDRDETLGHFEAVIRPAREENIESVSRLITECERAYRNGLVQMNSLATEMLCEINNGQGSLGISEHNEPSLASCVPFVSFMAGEQLHPAELLQWAIGVVFGRWDIRSATSSSDERPVANPLAPLPNCSPGMLQNDQGMPATASPEDYLVRVNWDGVLVDDVEHSDDLCSRLSSVLDVLWAGQTDAVTKRFNAILGVKDIRDYFRKPGKEGFWDDHVSRYTKSRRKAPIYWLLQSANKNYSIWLYYHRLDRDMLFKALVNYVEPKIRLESKRLETVRKQKSAAGDTGKEAKRLSKEIEQQEDFISELGDFDDKLRRAANLHLNPDLNDGVVLNIAPLHELVPWKEAKEYWQELLAGKYEWSSIGKQLRQKGLVK